MLVLFLPVLLSAGFLFTLLTQYVFARFEGRPLHFHEAVLFVAETLTTTGYGELTPFRSPVTTLWSLLLMASGFVMIFVWLASLGASWLAERMQPRAPRRAPRRASDHIIICGAGPAGRFLAHECQQARVPYVLVDTANPALEDALRHDLTVMEGDPREAEVLQAAGIDRARALATTLDDAENASICLMARAMRSDLLIASMVEHATNQPFLQAAGATEVVSAKRSLGQRLGWLCTAPLAGQLDRLQIGRSGLSFCQVPVLPGSSLAAPSLRQARIRERTGATVLGLWSQGHFMPIINADTPLRPGHLLIAAGRPDELDRLRALSQNQGRPLSGPEKDVLVLGSGDVGQAAIAVLQESGLAFRVLSRDVPPEEPEWMEGDATDRAELERAGIAQMGRCVVALDDDNRAVFATLIARQINPGLRIVARANSVEAVGRLYLAGADNVLSVSEVGGTQLARLLLPAGQGPPGLDELTTLEVDVPARLAGATLAGQRVTQRSGCIVLAVRNAADELEVNPSPRRVLKQRETLVLFGTEAQFERFASVFGT